MKAHSIEWTHIDKREATASLNPAARLNSALLIAARAFIALVPALAIVVGAAWLASAPDLAVYLQAALWTSGLVFLGLAIDSAKPANLAALLTGIALPALALLSSKVAVEIAILAAAVVAAWVAAAIFRR